MDDDRPTARDGTACAGCEWERHPPTGVPVVPELGAPLGPEQIDDARRVKE